MRFIIFICFILISCAENETFDTGSKNNSQVDPQPLNDVNYFFYINETDNLSLEDFTNKIFLPCGTMDSFPQQKQLPGQTMSYFNVPSIGIGFDCEEDGLVYPIAPGIVVDVRKDDPEYKMFDFYKRLVDSMGYMPQDIRKVFHRTHIVIDHGKYLNKKYRVLAVYSNLKNIDSSIVVGSNIKNSLIPIGEINTSELDLLTSFTEQTAEDTSKYFVKENTVNVDLLFEKDETTYFYPGKGVSLNRELFKEFFINRK